MKTVLMFVVAAFAMMCLSATTVLAADAQVVSGVAGTLLAAVAAATLYHASRPPAAAPIPIVTADRELQVAEGLIQSADPASGTLVLSTKERPLTFHAGAAQGDREVAILLNGKHSIFAAAIAPGRRARVSYFQLGEKLTVTRVQVTLPEDQ